MATRSRVVPCRWLTDAAGADRRAGDDGHAGLQKLDLAALRRAHAGAA